MEHIKISSELVGAETKEYRTEISWRHTTNYAAAVGDNNPFYLDDLRADGLVAPPMFVCVISWPLMQNISDFLDFPYPLEVLYTMVHYSQHVEYARPLKPGIQVKTTGKVIAMVPKRSGIHMLFKLPVTDLDGELYYTEYAGVMLRGVELTDAGKGAENIPVIPNFAQDSPLIWESVIPIRPEASYIYDGCSNVSFDIHTSPRFAKMVGLPGIILQGTATLAYAVKELINRESGGDPTRLKTLSAQFTGMVLPDSEIKIRLNHRQNIADKTELGFHIINDKGQTAVRNGYALISD